MHYEKLQQNESIVNAETDFWIGDPCYVVPDELWEPFCNNWSAYEKREENQDLPRCYVARVEHETTGLTWYTWSTAYGDGTYRLMIKNETVANLPVDAGTLSAIPMTLIEHWRETGQIGNYQDLGHVVPAEHLQGQISSHEGDLYWGEVFVPTSGTDESEEDECEEEGYFWC